MRPRGSEPNELGAAVGDDETIEQLLDGLNLVTKSQQDLRDSLHSKVL